MAESTTQMRKDSTFRENRQSQKVLPGYTSFFSKPTMPKDERRY